MSDKKQAVYYTIEELVQRGKDDVPEEFISGNHLIYSSPATLAFNSPGAEGFGVKRAGLAVPESVMLIVAPGCCGRNTSLISRLQEYDNRFFYLNMDETDIITGRHLKKIPQAIREVVAFLEKKPSVVMVCITCVDALLGTDMERVCKKAEEEAGLPVRPCYMYALTREGRKPPMVHVRQSIYSLLQPAKKKGTVVDILGFFAPLADDSELYDILHGIGVKTTYEISRCESYEEFGHMSEANFALILNPEARFAAKDFEEKLNIPSIELTRFYEIDRIAKQYAAFGSALGVKVEDTLYRIRALEAVQQFCAKYTGLHFCIGECLNADSFELALALLKYGYEVDEIFGTITAENFVYIRAIREISPDTRVYSNLHPSMIYYGDEDASCGTDSSAGASFVTIGKDAGYYHPDWPNLAWNSDVQPFGYEAVWSLFESLDALLSDDSGTENRAKMTDRRPEVERSPYAAAISTGTKGLFKYLTPFAPDQSGAVSVLYEFGGLLVICDAGGCTGNICGFDEPRWSTAKSAIFSAGLRDMDAIMGRDEHLVNKLALAAEEIEGNFAAVIGTPVPAVIATDYAAISRMLHRKISLPVLTINTTGMSYYDRGAEAAYLALVKQFCKEALPKEPGRIGVFGANPLDLGDLKAGEKITRFYKEKHAAAKVLCYGMGAGLEELKQASAAEINIVVSPSGLKAAGYLKEVFGTPYVIENPLAPDFLPDMEFMHQNVLILQQQVSAYTLRKELRARGAGTVTAADFFGQIAEIAEEGDIRLTDEHQCEELLRNGRFDVIIADPVFRKMTGKTDAVFIEYPQFAVSGKLME